METINLDRSIKVFYITAKSFPDGIQDAMKKLHALFPPSEKRRIFGLSRPEDGKEIVYKAAAEELATGEAEKFGCKSLIIKKGKYISLKVDHFQKDVTAIQKAFEKLLQTPKLDPEGYCVEWYDNDGESLKCMVRLNE